MGSNVFLIIGSGAAALLKAPGYSDLDGRTWKSTIPRVMSEGQWLL